jgi:hypothetical protein
MPILPKPLNTALLAFSGIVLLVLVRPEGPSALRRPSGRQVVGAAGSTTVGDRVMALTRASRWKPVSAVRVGFRTYHPQGMVKVGDKLFVSSVEVTTPTRPYPKPVDGRDRDAGAGTAHLFELDLEGTLLADVKLGEGAIYHPGGIDYDGAGIWVPVSEYRPDSTSIIYRVDPATMKATEVLRFADHIGAIVHDTDDDTLRGVSWGSRRFYRWTLSPDGRVTNAAAPPGGLRTFNTSHYVDYQDCKYVGRRRMLCTGVNELRPTKDAPPFRLGGLDVIDLADGRPLHQVPVLLWTAGGLDMTHNPSCFEPRGAGLRAYFMPEDDRSTIYVYDVNADPAESAKKK